MVWWMYFLSCHFLPVRRTFSALITTTKSPQSACGVNIGLCLPRSSVAMVVAARPSTLSFTSMTTQLRWTVFLLPITVFICGDSENRKPPAAKPLRGGGRYAIHLGVSTSCAPERSSERGSRAGTADGPTSRLEEVRHRCEEVASLRLLDLLGSDLPGAREVDHVQVVRWDVLEEPRRSARNGFAPPGPLCGAGEDETLPGAGHPHVAEAALLLQV